jgi:hypothetical protein
MSLEIQENDILQYKKLKLIGDLAPIKEHLRLFKVKYGLNYEQFEENMLKGKEDFTIWDDYMEWKAYKEKFDELAKTLAAMNNA